MARHSNAPLIDIAFDFRSDTPVGKDPDAVSPTLRRYHQHLWSKPLPSGEIFDLSVSVRGHYLYHRHPVLGEFSLSSDTAMQTFTGNTRPSYIEQLPRAENEAFMAMTYTVGGMMVFPGNRIDRKMTINQAKGCHPRIRDRFDLTVECIRQHYEGALNPLGEVLDRYDNFFALFGDFRGFVSFFFLNDLINDDSSVEFFAPASPAIPGDLGTYLEYRRRSIEFIQARNKRIEQWSKGESPRCDPPEPDC